MHVCIYFRDLFTTRWQSIKKDLIFWSDHGVEVQTCTKVVFLNSDEKTIFKTSLTHHPRSSLPQVGCVRGANTFPNHNQSLTRKSLTKTSQPGFPSNPQLNTRWRLLTKSIPITERKTAIARTGMPRGVFSDVRHLLKIIFI
jgi:hypothetical protein